MCRTFSLNIRVGIHVDGVVLIRYKMIFSLTLRVTPVIYHDQVRLQASNVALRCTNCIIRFRCRCGSNTHTFSSLANAAGCPVEHPWQSTPWRCTYSSASSLGSICSPHHEQLSQHWFHGIAEIPHSRWTMNRSSRCRQFCQGLLSSLSCYGLRNWKSAHNSWLMGLAWFAVR